MIATETVKTVLLILFGLAVLWIVVIIIKNDTQTIVRAILVAAVLGLGLYLVSRPGASVDGKISFASIRDHLFPVPERSYSFERREGHTAGRPATTSSSTIRAAPLSGHDGRRQIHGHQGHPWSTPPWGVRCRRFRGVPELASPDRTASADKFRWDDYERGVLVIERASATT
jgi:hypothetical protein